MPKTILVADDMPNGRELMRTVLERAGYSVVEAANGFEALEKVQSLSPDLVLLDVQMPGLNGFDVIARLRADERLRQLPVVALTAYAMQADREKALAAGFTSYLSKPVSLAALRSEVTRLLGDG
ncbi:MAG: response regulator [Acidobacteria bacterium]|nr:response regulator [Acidobacteriota bacterium]MBI3281637.1 response regulator [Acidobacteriota bacterium]